MFKMVKGQLVTLINSFPLKDGMIQKEKNSECNYTEDEIFEIKE